MSTATSATALMSSMDQAEKDLALYAAIIGCRPTVESARHEAPPAEEPVQTVDASADDAHPDDHIDDHIIDDHIEHDDAHHPHRLSIWMRHVSHEAKRRIHEAAMRLAS